MKKATVIFLIVGNLLGLATIIFLLSKTKSKEQAPAALPYYPPFTKAPEIKTAPTKNVIKNVTDQVAPQVRNSGNKVLEAIL